jgi:uncharacterized membrane protein
MTVISGGCLATVAVAAGLGHLGLALALVFLVPIPLTLIEMRRRRNANCGGLGVLRALPLTPNQERFFTAWFVYALFVFLAILAAAVGLGVRNLAR